MRIALQMLAGKTLKKVKAIADVCVHYGMKLHDHVRKLFLRPMKLVRGLG